MSCSASDSHLKLLDRVVRGAGFSIGGVSALVSHRHSFAPPLFNNNNNNISNFILIIIIITRE